MFRLRRVLLWLFLAVAALSPDVAAAQAIRIGVLAYLGAEHSTEEWAATANAIRKALPERAVEVTPLDHDALKGALKAGALDFVVTNPGHYIDLELSLGASRIATLQSEAPVASAIIVRADRADIAGLGDLAGKTLAIVGTKAFGGFQVAWRELQGAGIDPFKALRLVETGLPMTQVLDAVLTGRVDAGIVRGCLVEQRQREGRLAPGVLKVIGQADGHGTPCALSSRVYPDWPFAKARDTAPNLAKKVATALMEMPPQPDGTSWTIPVDYTPVHDLFRSLMIGPYESLRNPSLGALFRRYWHWLALALVAFGGWVVHVWRVEGLVRARTAELAAVNADLRREMAARQAAEEQDALHTRELEHAARLSVMGEMASGIAHELNQPLAAIINYADGCALRLESGAADPAELSVATARIRTQAERAGQVIQRMRAFVRKREPVTQPLALDEVVRETVELFEGPARRAGMTVTVDSAAGLPLVSGDRIQIQQVLLNLFQNGVDAGRPEAAGGRLRVRLEAVGAGVSVSVTDWGRGFSVSDKARLFEPFFTTKPSGLGVGLALCRTIAEDHGGRLLAEDNPEGGAIMRLWLPGLEEARDA